MGVHAYACADAYDGSMCTVGTSKHARLLLACMGIMWEFLHVRALLGKMERACMCGGVVWLDTVL